MDRDKATQIVFDAIDDINQRRGKDPKQFWTKEKGFHSKLADPLIEKSAGFLLLGSAIDSMEALDLVLCLEQQFEKRGMVVHITDSKAFSSVKGPFRTVGSVISMVEKLA